MYHRAKFCANRSRRCRDMAVFVFFKMAAVRHLGFSKVRNFNCPYPSGGPKCVIVPNFVQIGQTVAEIWPFTILQRSRRSPTKVIFAVLEL